MAALPRKRRNTCIAVLLALTGVVVLVVILALTVFKPKRPTIIIYSISLADLDVSLDPARLSVDLNLTLKVDLSVKNPDKVAFKYTDSIVLVSYRGERVGEAPIPAGRLEADRTKQMNLTLTIMADRMLSKSELFSDVVNGALPLDTYARLSGKVTVMGVLKIHVVASSSCDFIIDLEDRKIANQQCQYQTKL